MSTERTAFAFHPTAITPTDILEFGKVLDQSEISHIFLNESSVGFDPMEISAGVLAVSSRILAGTGIIRIHEHDEKVLLKRLKTLQAMSCDRFVLGIGTGLPGSDPMLAIERMLHSLGSLRRDWQDSGFKFPLTFIATLRKGIAKKVAGKSDGIFLNLCSPEYAGKLVTDFRKLYRGDCDVACLIKVVFSSGSDEAASKLLAEEFVKHFAHEHYRKMFADDGVFEDIKKAKLSMDNGKVDLPSSLLRIGLVNPSSSELRSFLRKFRNAGVTLPCIYPYFPKQETFDFRLSCIKSLTSVVT